MTLLNRIGVSCATFLALILICVVFWQDFIYSRLFDLHASCYRWYPPLIALHVSSDFFTGCAYLFISAILFFFVVRLRLPFNWIFFCFAAFIICCGVTHFMEIVTTIWTPVYWLSGYIKAVTALASVGTAVLLPPLLPKVREAIALSRKADEQSKELATLYAQLEHSYYALVNSMPLLVWTCDANGGNQFFNEAWQKYTGLTQAQLVDGDSTRSHYISHEDLQRIHAMWRQAFITQTQYEVEIRLRRSDGMYLWHLLRAIPKVEEGAIKGWISTATDIHRQKQNEQALRETQERQDTFLSMASHELKTPLTSMQLLISFLRREIGNEPKYGKAITTIEGQCKRLVRLTNDLLDVSRVKADRMALTRTEFDVCVFIRNVVTMLQNGVSTHRIDLVCSGITSRLVADKDRIGQVLVNLLTNAIKYSPESKSVTVRVTQEDTSIVFAVSDTGIGMSEEAQQHIFEPYYRSIGKDNQKYPGLGIGLYIASELVRRHNGKMWVKSVLGKGSTFYFSLPLGTGDSDGE